MPKNNEEKYNANRLNYILYNKYIWCIMNSMRYTVKDFHKDYPNDDVCLDSIFQNRYGDVKDCPACGVVNTKFYRVRGRKCYACEHCGYQLHPLAQTIFHKSSTPLTDWFFAIYLFSVAKNGVSAKELERHLGVTYKTAHRMARQIRKLMEDENELSGNVEIDETYIGGRRKLAHKFENKSAVFGMVERNGFVSAKHVKSTGARVLLPEIEKTIKIGSIIHSDEWQAYKTLNRRGYTHTTVNHSNLEYVRGSAYTNTIEGFWSQLKRSLDGTYHAVSPKYLQLYVNEFVFRYNLRGVAVYPVLLERASKRV